MAVIAVAPIVEWIIAGLFGYGAHKALPGTDEREEDLRNLGRAVVGNHAASQMEDADDGAEEGAVSGDIADSCTTCDPPPECRNIIDNMRGKNRKLKAELEKYDPISDANGGHVYRLPTGEMKVTRPGGHYQEIRDLQRGLKGDMERYNQRRCYNTPGDHDKITIRAAQRGVNQNIRVPPGHQFIPL